MSKQFFHYLSDLPQRRIDLQTGGMVFQQGDRVQNIYRVATGEVQLLRRQPDGAACILQRALPGDLLAEASLLSAVYHCAAEATTASRLLVWRKKDVVARLDQSPDMAAAYASHLADEVRRARLRSEILSLKRLPDRLDAWLVWHDGGLPDKGQWQRLAQDINVSPAALYRELAKRRAAS